ncbi:hypothetical protein [Rossellomorea marisflavi]|uniref:hypothetical protein n=1 Tax=Rossellomorea marisflavi TaxID=189381 RepID=UPI003F9F4AD8
MRYLKTGDSLSFYISYKEMFLMRKNFKLLKSLDQENLKFLTKYLKHAISYPRHGSLDKLLDIGTVVKHSHFGLCVVVGYCGTGSEYLLYEANNESGYKVTGVQVSGRMKKIKKVSPLEGMPLLVKTNEYLMKNSFELSTSHQQLCYEHWLRTGHYEFVNPIGNKGK